MDNKLSELSKPVAYSLRFRNLNGEPDKTINANTTFSTLEKAKAYGLGSRYVTQDDGKIVSVRDPSQDPIVEPLYSQEYVSALLADNEALKIRSGQQQSVAANNLEMFRKADERAETLLAELEAKDKRITTVTEEREFWRERVDGAEKEREEFRRRFNLERSCLEDADKRIAELEGEFAFIMGQNDGMEKELREKDARIEHLEAKLATPVRLQSPWVDKVGNRWLLEGTTAEVIRAAGFKVEGDAQ